METLAGSLLVYLLIGCALAIVFSAIVVYSLLFSNRWQSPTFLGLKGQWRLSQHVKYFFFAIVLLIIGWPWVIYQLVKNRKK